MEGKQHQFKGSVLSFWLDSLSLAKSLFFSFAMPTLHFFFFTSWKCLM